MELPNSIFDRITGSSNAASPDSTPENDRRQYRRLPFGSRAAMYPVRNGDEGPPSIVMLRDISIGGIGFLHAEPIDLGDPFILRFTGQQGQPVKLKCVTQRCDPGGTGGTQFIIGGTFEQLIEPTEESIQAAGGGAVAASAEAAPARMMPAIRRPSSLFSSPKPASASVADTSAPAIEVQAPPAALKEVAKQDPPAANLNQNLETVTMNTVVANPVLQPPSQAEINPAPMVEAIPMAAFANEPSGAPVGSNQEMVAKVKARLLGQGQALQTQGKQLEEARKQLVSRDESVTKLASERDELKALLEKAQTSLARQHETAEAQMKGLRDELLGLRQARRILQAKSEADDKAIADLVALIGPGLMEDTRSADMMIGV